MTFLSVIDNLIETAKQAKNEAYVRSWNPQLTSAETDRNHTILSLKLLKNEFTDSRHRGNDHQLISALIEGRFHPNCAQGAGINPTCGDTDRAFNFQPNLRVALKLAQQSYKDQVNASMLAVRHHIV